jgi:hypothetical protein
VLPGYSGGGAAGAASLGAAERALNKDLNANGIIGMKTGSWEIMEDNLLTALHKKEVVIPPYLGDLVREFGSTPLETATPKTSPMAGMRFENAMKTSDNGRGGTFILQIGDEKLVELVDQGLAISDPGTHRVSLGSKR